MKGFVKSFQIIINDMIIKISAKMFKVKDLVPPRQKDIMFPKEIVQVMNMYQKPTVKSSKRNKPQSSSLNDDGKS